MANFSTLKAAINAVIKTNGQKEITGEVLNQVLNAMVTSLGANYQFAGVATPSTNPGTPDQNVFYMAIEAGTYTNFNATVLPAGISILLWNGSWSHETFFGIDSVPTSGSDNLISSGAVFEKMKLDGGAYDVSAHNGGATFASLSALLSSDNLNTLIPVDVRHGGMSIRFVQSSDNKYVQFCLMATSFSTTESDWQGVDDVPTAGSDNLVKSGGVVDYTNSRIMKIVGIFANGSVYAPNWQVGDIMFNSFTNLLRRCTAVDAQGDAASFETVPFETDVIYSWNKILWKWNGTKMIPLSKIITLVSITNDSAVNALGDFWYSSTYKVIRICTKLGTEKTHYDLGILPECLFLWNGVLYQQDISDGHLKYLVDATSIINSATTYTDEQLNKTRIPIVFIGYNGSFYAPNWHVGDIMFNTITHLIRKCESVSQGDAATFSTIQSIEDTVLIYRGLSFIIDENSPSHIKCISHIIPVQSITNSDAIEVGELYLSSVYKDLRIKQTSSDAIPLGVLEDTLYLYNDSLWRVLDGNIVSVESGANIFTSSYNSTIATTSIPINTITPSKRIRVDDLVIANPTNSYLYRTTAVGTDNITVAYYSTLKGEQGVKGEQGEQGNSGYSGAAGELEVVNNLTDGGATAALSAEQGKILNRWNNYNASELVVNPKNPKSKQIIPLSAWRVGGSIGSIDSATSLLYDEILQDFVEVKKCHSNNSTSIMDGAIYIADLNNAINMSDKVLRGAIYLDENFNVSNLGNTNISLYSDNQTDSLHRAFISLNYAISTPGYTRTRWFHFIVNFNVQSETIGANFDITNVTAVGYNVNNAAGTELLTAMTMFDILPQMQRGGILTIIDNFNPNVPTMAEYAASKGVKLNLSIIPKWINDGDSRTVTLDKVYKAALQGHYIFNHTWNHQIYAGQTPFEVFEQVNKADRWMVERGLIKGAKVLSNPSAAFDNDKYEGYFASEAKMLYHHWTSYVVPATRGDGSTKCTLYYPYKGMERLLNISALDSYYSNDWTKIATDAVKGVNAAIANGGIFVFGFHGVKYGSEGYIPNMSIWEDYIDAISELNVYHYTIDELLEGAYI